MRLLVKLIVIVAAGVGIQKAIDAKVPYEAWFTFRAGLLCITGDETVAQAMALEYVDHLPFRTDPVAAASAKALCEERLRIEAALGPDLEALWDDAEIGVASCHDLTEAPPVRVVAVAQ